MPLFHVDGARHHAVVIARSKEEAIELAVGATTDRPSPLVIFGSVDRWEGPQAMMLRLPKGFHLVRNSKKKDYFGAFKGIGRWKKKDKLDIKN